MKIAYMIMAHTDPQQLGRLVRALYVEGQTDFYIHIDARKDIAPFQSAVKAVGNVTFCGTRIHTTWGGYSQVRTYQELMRNVIDSGNQYDRVFLLSGLDYPLWSNDRILTFLEDNAERELIMARNISGTAMAEFKLKCYHFFRDLKIQCLPVKVLKTLSRHLMKILPIRKKDYVVNEGRICNVYYGSEWFALTGTCLKYVYDQLCNNACWEKYFKYTFAPDEMVVATTVFNSSFAPRAYLYTDSKPGLESVTMLHYIEYEECIHTYDETAYDKLMDSGKMFVRKLISGKSEKLIDMIDRARRSQ